MPVTPPRDLEELSELLDEAEDRVALALEACGAGIWDWHIPTDKLHWGSGMLRLFGVVNFNGSYSGFEGCLHPADAVRVRETLQRAIDTRTVFDCSFRLISRPGVVIRGRGKCYYQNGAPLRFVGVNVEELPIRPACCPSTNVDCPLSKDVRLWPS